MRPEMSKSSLCTSGMPISGLITGIAISRNAAVSVRWKRYSLNEVPVLDGPVLFDETISWISP